jgi:eukaryotic-like serine/threonine-protein kinase
MPLGPGTQLGAFEIMAALGAGGMGEVYRARDTRLDRIVAIKMLPAALASDPEFRERFNREARIISQLEHPHICMLYDVGRQDGTAYLVVEYLEGETLADRLTRGALRLDQAMSIAIDLTDALAAAHRAGITHRDFKPGNVFLTKAGAKLLDFGLAKTQAPLMTGRRCQVVCAKPAAGLEWSRDHHRRTFPLKRHVARANALVSETTSHSCQRRRITVR